MESCSQPIIPHLRGHQSTCRIMHRPYRDALWLDGCDTFPPGRLNGIYQVRILSTFQGFASDGRQPYVSDIVRSVLTAVNLDRHGRIALTRQGRRKKHIHLFPCDRA